jgi:hypothetical protein
VSVCLTVVRRRPYDERSCQDVGEAYSGEIERRRGSIVTDFGMGHAHRRRFPGGIPGV